MKPYFAVLYDSFQESVRSKVLWILLVAWTLILAALFPLSISQGESYAFTFADIENPRLILDNLASASAGRGTRSQKALYSKLDAEFQGILIQRQNNKRRIFTGMLTAAFNKLLTNKDLYDKEAWPTADRRKELKPLIENENKSAAELEKLNRSLIDLAFPGSTRSASGQASWITYGGLKLGGALPFTEQLIKPFIESVIFPLVMRLGLGIAAMFVAIIITSPMIPDMFQTGSLQLLLSKPLSRNLLFLTKFLGGCIFVAFNIVFLLVGLYLYAGTRLGIWNIGILWCIPLFIFAFMIFYSVSAFVGLIWKNPIICVVITAVFWGVCFGVGLIHFYFDFFLHVQPQTQRIYAINDTVMLTTQQGRLQFWDEAFKGWRTAYGDVEGQKVMGPVWLESEKAIYFGRPRFNPFGMGGGQGAKLEFARTPDLADAADTTFSSKIWEDGRMDSGPDLPSDPLQIIPWKNTLAVLNENGIFLFNPAGAVQAEERKPIADFVGRAFSGVFGNTSSSVPSEAFVELAPKDWNLVKPLDVSASPSFQHMLTYSRAKVCRWNSEQAILKREAELDLNIPPATVAAIGTNDNTCIVCPNGMKPFVIDVETMQVRKQLDEMGEVTIKQIVSDNNGNFIMLSPQGVVWLYDSRSDKVSRPSLSGQGKAHAIHLTKDGLLWVAHSGKKADLWDVQENSSKRSLRPKANITEMIYGYLINPFYEVNPKPAAVNETIEYVLKNPKNKSLAVDRNDLDAPTIQTDPWRPIWTNFLFVVVMLSVSCLYLSRQDL